MCHCEDTTACQLTAIADFSSEPINFDIIKIVVANLISCEKCFNVNNCNLNQLTINLKIVRSDS